MPHIISYGLQRQQRNEVKNGGYYEPVGKNSRLQATSSGIAEICHDEALADRLCKWTKEELEGLQESRADGSSR